MPSAELAGGRIRIAFPSTYEVSPASGSAQGKRKSAAKGTQESSPLLHALREQEFELIERVNFDPVAPRQGTGKRAPRRAPTRITLEVDHTEDAVILLEQDGVYSWEFPSKHEEIPNLEQPARRGAAGAATKRRVQFQFDLIPEISSRRRSKVTERPRLGPLGDFVIGKITGYVFKFAAKVVAGKAMTYLERDVRTGLVEINSSNVADWKRIDDLSNVRLPSDRPPRLLFLIHGCFASTVGSYGTLGATRWGRSFLESAIDHYDAVLGFDHRTLSEDPLENATELLRRCSASRTSIPPTLDFVCFSRGALVVRSFVEQVLPGSSWKANANKIVFIAGANGGTRLAEPENWHSLVDLYVNLVSAAAGILSLFPGAAPVTGVVSGLMQSLGAFVKYLVSYAVTDRVVPGLAAMEPDGVFLRTLNRTQPGQPSPGTPWYVVSSNFEAKLLGKDHEPKEFPRRLAISLTDGFIDSLMNAPNDLVVDVDSMHSFDTQESGFIKDVFDFGSNSQVHHLAYFSRPEVCSALGKWLGFHREEKPVASPGSIISAELPVTVDDNIAVASDSDSVASVRGRIKSAHPDYAVIKSERVHREAKDIYVYTGEEISFLLEDAPRDTPVAEALGLEEKGPAEEKSVTEAHIAEAVQSPPSLAPGPDPAPPPPTGVGPAPEPAPPPPGSTSEPVVVTDRSHDPVGVIDEFSIRAIGELASMTRESGDMRSFAARRGRGGTRGARKSAGKPKGGRTRAERQGKQVVAYARAEMPAHVVVGDVATLSCAISRHDINGWTSRTVNDSGHAAVVEDEPLTLQVVPKRNVDIVGDERVTVQLPQIGMILETTFQIKPTSAGECEIWIEVHQGHSGPLLSLRLEALSSLTAPQIPSTYTQVYSAIPVQVPDIGDVQLRIIEIEKDREVTFRYDLTARDLNVLDSWNSAPIRNRDDYVASIYREIEERWIHTHEDAESFEQELREYGGDLFDQLFPEALQRILWKHRKKIRNIIIISEEPFIPWELIHLKEPGKPLPRRETCFIGQLGAVRWLRGGGAGGGYPPDLIKVRPGCAHFLVPDYLHPDYRLDETKAEARFLKERLSAVEVEPTEAAVRRLLRSKQLDILHFAGHGLADSDDISNASILLAGRTGNGDPTGPDYVPAKITARAVRNQADFGDNGGPLVVLNACQVGRLGRSLSSMGGFAEAFLKRGAAAFVSSLWAVGDTPARAFVESFYEILLGGGTFAEAVVTARETARSSGDATWLAYAVYANPHAKLYFDGS